MEILLYDKTPFIGNILKDWLLDIVDTKANINYVKSYSGLTEVSLEKRYDLSVIDIDFPLDELYNLINSLCAGSAATKILFTTFSINSGFDLSKVACQEFKTYDKASGYFSFCDSVQSLISQSRLKARCA